MYSEDRTKKEFSDYLKKVFDARKTELESLIKRVKTEENKK